jgi:hypothetical protein
MMTAGVKNAEANERYAWRAGWYGSYFITRIFD